MTAGKDSPWLGRPRSRKEICPRSPHGSLSGSGSGLKFQYWEGRDGNTIPNLQVLTALANNEEMFQIIAPDFDTCQVIILLTGCYFSEVSPN